MFLHHSLKKKRKTDGRDEQGATRGQVQSAGLTWQYQTMQQVAAQQFSYECRKALAPDSLSLPEKLTDQVSQAEAGLFVPRTWGKGCQMIKLGICRYTYNNQASWMLIKHLAYQIPAYLRIYPCITTKFLHLTADSRILKQECSYWLFFHDCGWVCFSLRGKENEIETTGWFRRSETNPSLVTTLHGLRGATYRPA